MGEKKTGDLRISISVKEGCVNVGRGVIRALGFPRHVRILRNIKGDSIALQPCNKNETFSFMVPEQFLKGKDTKMRIISKSFCKDILEENNLDLDRTYIVPGELREEQTAIVFDIKQASVYKEVNKN